MSEQTRQYQDMAKTASWTMVSRVLGLFRDQLIAAFFGASAIGAAFLFAFQIPNLFRRLLGEGALTAATVPVLAEIEAKHGRPAAHAFLNYVLGKVLPWLLGITLVGIGLALMAMLLLKDPRYVHSAEFTAWCMPYMPLICVAALFTSAVNLSGRFGLAEIASSGLNVCMILGLGFFGYYLGDGDLGRARWLCFGTLAGGALQLLIPMWGLRQAGWRSTPVRADAAAWQALRVAFIPAALGAGILQINFLISRSLAFDLEGATLTYYYIANRIVELPIGLFSTAIATVMFPAMATAFAEKDTAAMGRNYARGMRLIMAINIGAAIGLAVYSEQIIRLLFEFGRFSAEDCAKTRSVLVLFALAMPFHAMISMVTRALNVAGQTQATFRVALWAVGINITGSVAAIVLGHGIEGLATANAASAMVQYFLLRRELRRTAPSFLAENLTTPFLQALGGSLVMGIVAYQGFGFISKAAELWLNTKVNLLLSMALAGGLAATCYAGLLIWWKYPERDLVIGFGERVLRKLRLRR
ncbi:MAG: murein biosynthesis integral membrane protein MurJ [Opitutia bacterium AMD-G3]|jgi:putative peptidoglycan lipid II flippase|nr:MAG: murein biosynthesis integral membrane protein MurJ [Opitutae bacterium AMD-G3]